MCVSNSFRIMCPLNRQAKEHKERFSWNHSHLHHLSGNREGRWGTTDDFTTSFLSNCPCSPLPSGTWRSQGLSIPWCCPPTSSSVCLVFFPLSLCRARWFWQTWWTGNMTIPLQFASLYDRQEVFVWSDCLLDLGTDFLVGNMVFVRDASYLAVAPHFHGLYSSTELCSEGPWFTSTQEDGCDKEAHQSYLGTKRNTPVISNCSCHSKLVSTLSILLLSVLF